MDLRPVRAAIADLKLKLRNGEDPQKSVDAVCGEHSAPEYLVRHWFFKGEQRTPEEYGASIIVDVSTETAIAAAASKWVAPHFGPNLVGRRFVLNFSMRDGRLVEGEQAYRYIGFNGHAIEAIDEGSLEVMKIDGGPEIWAEIHEKVAKAPPYKGAEKLRFAGSDRELSARESVFRAIRLVLLTGVESSEFEDRAKGVDEKLEGASNLTSLYQNLTRKQRDELTDHIQNPVVDAVWQESGTLKRLSDGPLEVLRQLERGEVVPSPVHERIRDWKAQKALREREETLKSAAN